MRSIGRNWVFPNAGSVPCHSVHRYVVNLVSLQELRHRCLIASPKIDRFRNTVRTSTQPTFWAATVQENTVIARSCRVRPPAVVRTKFMYGIFLRRLRSGKQYKESRKKSAVLTYSELVSCVVIRIRPFVISHLDAISRNTTNWLPHN